MQQSSYVILVIFAVTLTSVTQAIPQRTCLKDGNKCTANTDCCNGFCVQNHCADYADSSRISISKRETEQHSTCENLNPPCKHPYTCVLQQVQCFRAPCYPIPTCALPT